MSVVWHLRIYYIFYFIVFCCVRVLYISSLLVKHLTSQRSHQSIVLPASNTVVLWDSGVPLEPISSLHRIKGGNTPRIGHLIASPGCRRMHNSHSHTHPTCTLAENAPNWSKPLLWALILHEWRQIRERLRSEVWALRCCITSPLFTSFYLMSYVFQQVNCLTPKFAR